MSQSKLETQANKKLLVVDDDDIFRERLIRAFASRNYIVEGANCVDAALHKTQIFQPDMVLVDLRMPGASGLDLVSALSELQRGIKIVVLTGYGSIATALDAVARGAFNYLTKPTDADKILDAFEARPVFNSSHNSRVPSLESVEWEHINRVVSDCEGNISRAAKLLGLHRRSLQRKLSKKPSAVGLKKL